MSSPVTFSRAYGHMEELNLTSWLSTLPAKVHRRMDVRDHGDLKRWYRILTHLPSLPTGPPVFTSGTVCLRGPDGEAYASAEEAQNRAEDGSGPGEGDTGRVKLYDRLAALFGELRPWRKGPFDIHGVFIDSEWRSHLKWERVAGALADLDGGQAMTGRRILDVGSGNGYYMLRMLEHSPAVVFGVDPSRLYVCQFTAVTKYMDSAPLYVLPLGGEELPGTGSFDLVFSMGVLYHRRSPFDHLIELREQTASGGRVVLETLTVDGPQGTVFVPADRYAKMNNVWFLPSPSTLEAWALRAGFRRAVLVHSDRTTTDEQRATEWTFRESLSDFLDPEDAGKTVEGHPAPVRTIFLLETT